MKEDHSEILDGLKDSIYDILGDISPHLPTEIKNKLSKEYAEQTLKSFIDQLDRVEKEHDVQVNILERSIANLVNDIKDLEDTMKDLRAENNSLEKIISINDDKIEDLMLKINDPTAWAGKKFGI